VNGLLFKVTAARNFQCGGEEGEESADRCRGGNFVKSNGDVSAGRRKTPYARIIRGSFE